MTYPGTQQPGTGTEVRNDATDPPTGTDDSPGGREDPTQDERSAGGSHVSGGALDGPDGHPS